MEQSTKNSEDQAMIIACMNVHLHLIDVDYLRQAAKDMRAQASRQESMAVLLPSYPQEKNELLYLQAKAIDILCDYKEASIAIDKKKVAITSRQEILDQVNNLFL